MKVVIELNTSGRGRDRYLFKVLRIVVRHPKSTNPPGNLHFRFHKEAYKFGLHENSS